MAAGTWKDADPYRLKAEWVAFPADGRAEEKLGQPVVITEDRDGWYASGHVARAIARTGVSPGWLWLILATSPVQAQIKSLAAGSVIDALYPSELENVLLPTVGKRMGAGILASWALFAEAARDERKAVSLVENALE
jgi:hypothetical protein